MNLIKILSLGIILIFFQSFSFSKPITYQLMDSTLALQLQFALDNGLKSQKIVGASAAVIIPGKGIWLGVSGFSNPNNSDSMRSDMLLGIGSITKNFTAALILKLYEEGSLDLKDSIYKYLPNFPFINSTITIRQLLNHTSGIFDISESKALEDSSNLHPEKYWAPQEILQNYMETPYFKPGDSWGYSNTNYILLGMICEKVTQSKISNEYRKRFYKPLNLPNTFLDVEDTVTGVVAHSWVDIDNNGILEDNSSIPRTASYSIAWAAGAIFSTAESIARWTKYLFEGEIISRSTLNEMLTFYPINNFIPYYTGCGLGIWRMKFFNRELWGHGGGGLGYTAIMIYSPADSISIAILVNQNTSVAEIAASLLEVALNNKTSIQEQTNTEKIQFTLSQNYPNPFNPSTKIKYYIPKVSNVQLTIYDIMGREVRTLVNEHMGIGYKEVVWDGTDNYNQKVSSGIYIYRLRATSIEDLKVFDKSAKLVLMK